MVLLTFRVTGLEEIWKNPQKIRYVKNTQSVRSRNKVVDGEPVAEQKRVLLQLEVFPFVRLEYVRKRKG